MSTVLTITIDMEGPDAAEQIRDARATLDQFTPPRDPLEQPESLDPVEVFGAVPARGEREITLPPEPEAQGFIDAVADLLTPPEPVMPENTSHPEHQLPPEPVMPENTSHPEHQLPPPPVPPVTGNAEERDEGGKGIYWHKDIHVTTHTRRKRDDTWKLIPGLDPAFVEQVKTKIRADIEAHGTVAAPPPLPRKDEKEDDGPPVIAFAEFVNMVNAGFDAASITRTDLDSCLIRHGLNSLQELAGKPTLIPIILDELGLSV